MPSSYSPSLKIELIGTGEQDTTWGSTTNNNFEFAIEQAITGVGTVTFASADYTLPFASSNAAQDFRNMKLILTGTTGGARNLIVPNIEKLYFIDNTTSDTITVKTSAGTGVAVPSGAKSIVYADGVNVTQGINHINSPAFSGTPTAPTAALNTNTTQLATTAFTVAEIADAIADQNLGTIATQDANNVAITGGTIVDTSISGSSVAGTSLIITNTESVTLATGTTAQRPGTPLVGMFRMNTTLNMPEWYDAANSRWNLFSDLVNTYMVEYLIVGGGGGGGGYAFSGGGGGGGVLSGIFIVTEGNTYAVGVGAGGVGGNFAYATGVNGQPSFFGALIAPGGGGGGSYNARDLGVGKDGGCGGGNSGYYSEGGGYNWRGSGMMGFHGGYGGIYGGGGGGGAGGNGANGTSVSGGAGGVGRVSTITGGSVTYAGGGGGGAYTVSGGPGGAGGGGSGASGSSDGGDGSANSGGGGGGVAGGSSSAAGGDGGSGIVIIRYFGGARATGGSITTAGDYTVHTFTNNGNFIA